MASAQVEVGSAAASAAPELRLYHLGHKGVTRVASLGFCSPLPAAAHHVGAAVDGVAEDAQVGQGFYLAVLEGGEVVDFARLFSLDGRQFAASTREEAAAGYGEAAGKGSSSISVEETTVGKGKEEEEGELLSASEEEKEKEEAAGSSLGEEEEKTAEQDWDETLGEDGEETAEEDGEETSGEDEDETSDDGEDGDETSEEGEKGKTSSTEEEDEWEESSEDVDYSQDSQNESFLQVRIWPGSSYAVLIFYCK